MAYLAAKQRWDEERERLRAETGESAANEAQRDPSVAACEVRDRLANMRPTTLAGLTFKAKYAGSHYSGDYDGEITASIIEDLVALSLDS